MAKEYTLDRAGNGNGMPTPWGRAQATTTFEPGFLFVETAGHGGFLLSRKFAADHLSEAGRRHGSEFAQWLAYEEDSDANIIFYEMRERLGEFAEGTSVDDVRASLDLYLGGYLSEREQESSPDLK
jgi:hypothetical protein